MSSKGPLKIPEPSTGLSQGFLSEYWQRSEPLTRTTKGEEFFYYLQRGLKTVFAYPVSGVVSVLTITCVLFLLSGALLLVVNLRHLAVQSGGSLLLSAMINPAASEQSITALQRELEARTAVQSVIYLSKEQALSNFQKFLGTDSGQAENTYLKGLENDNPLPASLEITMEASERGRQELDALINYLKGKKDLLSEVLYGREWLDSFEGALKVITRFSIAVFCIVALVAIFLLGNTLRLVFYSRRDEISIMQLVGASPGFVRLPFIVGGVIQGIIGSALCVGLLWFAYQGLNNYVLSNNVFGAAFASLIFLNIWSTLGLFFAGILIGVMGSLLALGRYMNV